MRVEPVSELYALCPLSYVPDVETRMIDGLDPAIK
jgi:hypothetical protein